MHPAYSVIFFTVASGTGYGLLASLALVGLAGALPASGGFAWTALLIAFGLITFGLLSSTFHLGHPERAWRALSQWRSSWLSREGLLAVATYPVAGLWAIGWLFLAPVSGELAPLPAWVRVAALATVLLCVITAIATAMIYRSLKPVHQWHNDWVVPGYLALGAMAGAAWLHALAVAFEVLAGWTGWLAVALVIPALVLKLGYWRYIDSSRGRTTPETATGLGELGRVRLLDPPHTEENYLQKEMGFRIARKHASKLRRLAISAGFIAPLCATVVAGLVSGWLAAILALIAALSMMAGLLVERWLFFAEAKHSVMLYYGADRA